MITHAIDHIHTIIGYCSQYNILREELTAWDHLNLFARLRNTPVELRTCLITQKLEKVNLVNAADKQAGTNIKFKLYFLRFIIKSIRSLSNPFFKTDSN